MPTPDKLGSTRLVAAVPGALTAVLLVGAVALGASTLRPAPPAAEPAAPVEPQAVVPDPTPKPRISVAFDPDRVDPKPTAAPAEPKPTKPDATPKPKPSP